MHLEVPEQARELAPGDQRGIKRKSPGDQEGDRHHAGAPKEASASEEREDDVTFELDFDGPEGSVDLAFVQAERDRADIGQLDLVQQQRVFGEVRPVHALEIRGDIELPQRLDEQYANRATDEERRIDS